ncbi:hypothetical protein V6N12_037673 [Hibiscus sabdariffa]|uniref:C-CAP/cofactor C-like domain-containing protein n=1 Tax=Hibiscus sabdariffa TaxID=183260 RepID=A0ABR2C1D1_9ROSI
MEGEFRINENGSSGSVTVVPSQNPSHVEMDSGSTSTHVLDQLYQHHTPQSAMWADELITGKVKSLAVIDGIDITGENWTIVVSRQRFCKPTPRSIRLFLFTHISIRSLIREPPDKPTVKRRFSLENLSAISAVYLARGTNRSSLESKIFACCFPFSVAVAVDASVIQLTLWEQETPLISVKKASALCLRGCENSEVIFLEMATKGGREEEQRNGQVKMPFAHFSFTIDSTTFFPRFFQTSTTVGNYRRLVQW